MTMPSRGISSIQRKARGKDTMAKKMSSAGVKAPPRSEKTSMKISKRRGPMMGDMGGAPAMPMGMKKGGSCAPKMAKGGSCKGYYKGGSVDGIVKKGRTKGKMC